VGAGAGWGGYVRASVGAGISAGAGWALGGGLLG